MPRELVISAGNYELDDEGEWVPVGCTVIWKENGKLYRAIQPTEDYSLEDLAASELIPFEHLYPRWDNALTEVPQPLPEDCYVKTPNLIQYSSDSPDLLPRTFLHEIRLYEQFAANPHPNICAYYGCIREGDFITGIALRHYPTELFDLVVSDARLDRRHILTEVKSGLLYLHSQGYVHNDLNPRNVMLDDDGAVVLIDFGFTGKEGTRKGSVGTPGWFRSSEINNKGDDYFALGLLARFLDKREDAVPDHEYPADAVSLWSEDYLKPKVLVSGTLLALENACDVLLQMLPSWFRMTFLVENITDLEERPCFAPFLEHEDVLIVEGDMFARGDYERTWRVASFGLRTGELDFVLFVSNFDTDSEHGAQAFQAWAKTAMSAPLIHAWSSDLAQPHPWLLIVNMPSGKSDYISSLQHLTWHQCGEDEETHEPKPTNKPSTLIRQKTAAGDLVVHPGPATSYASRCFERILVVSCTALQGSNASSASLPEVVRALFDGTFETWKENWEGARRVSRNWQDGKPGMWMGLDALCAIDPSAK